MPTLAISGGSPVRNPALPTLPNYGGGATQDRANIDQLLTGNFDPYEQNMQAAEGALGTGGGGFAGAQRMKLLDSEKLARMKLGHEELNPYLEREQQTALQTSANAARMNEIAAEGAQALQRLQMSEAGQSARLSEQERADLERQVLSGNQAMQQLQLRESGDTSRQRTQIGGQLANTILSSSLSGGGGGGGGGGLPRYNAGKYGGQSYNYTTDFNGGSTFGLHRLLTTGMLVAVVDEAAPADSTPALCKTFFASTAFDNMAKDLLYPEDGVDEQGDPYYTLPDNPDDKLAAGSRGAVAFSEPDQNGLRYPVATPELGSWQPDSAPSPESLNGVNGGTYVPGSEKLTALPGGGYNQAYAADELKSQYGNDPHALQSAIRFQGLQEYKKLIDGGASDSEALRLAAPKLYFNHPAAMNSALKFAGTQSPNGIRSVPVPGGNAVLNPNGTIHSVLRNPTPARELKAVIPPDAKFAVADATDEVKDLNKSLRDINTSVATGKMDEAEAKPMRDKITTQLQAARENRMKLSTNWMNRNAPPAPASESKSDEMVSVVSPDGKTGKVPRSKLDAAKKAGYKEQ